MKLFLAIIAGVVGIGLVIVSVLLWGIANDLPDSERQIKLMAAAGTIVGVVLLGTGYAMARGRLSRTR